MAVKAKHLEGITAGKDNIDPNESEELVTYNTILLAMMRGREFEIKKKPLLRNNKRKFKLEYIDVNISACRKICAYVIAVFNGFN